MARETGTRIVLTYRDYEALPADGRRYELHEGDLAVTPAPGTLHQRAVGMLYRLLSQYVEAHRLGDVFVSPVDCILSNTTVVQPDIVYVESNRSSLVSARGIEGPPTLVIEVLSGYRLKERAPTNIGEFTLPLGVPELLREGADVTIVTYGALCRIALEAAQDLAAADIDVEIVDVRTLLPFDLGHTIVGSVRKTGALLVVDEDLPGGASAYILQQTVETQGAIDHLDVGPRTLSARANRTPVGVDGDYFSKPSREDIFAAAYAIQRERHPDRFPSLDIQLES